MQTWAFYCPWATSDPLLGETAVAGGGDGSVGIEYSRTAMGRWGLEGYSGRWWRGTAALHNCHAPIIICVHVYTVVLWPYLVAGAKY